MIGKTISHYKIIEKVGEGGMGVVYKALDSTLDRFVALKFISASLAADESMKHRLMHEAKACASLNHPNITTIYEFVQTEEYNFIAIEFIDGQTLDNVLRKRQFTQKEILDLALQLLDGLGAAHRKGIIHRDLKVQNIMLDSSNRARIMDFGLAKLAQGSMLTQEGATLGTAAYMSPEQARGEATDHRTDIYSLGVVLYQLLTGVLPFSHPHRLAILYAVVNENPKPLRDVNPTISEQLEKIVLKAMAKNPEERFQSCGEMAQIVSQLRENIGGETSKRNQFTPVGDRVPAALRARTTEIFSGSFGRRVFGKGLGISVILALAYGVTTIFTSLGDATGDPNRIITSGQRMRAQDHTEMALSLMNENKATEAYEQLQSAIEADSTYGLAWANLAVLNIRAGSFDVAMKQGKKAIALLDNVSGSAVCYNLGYTFEETGNSDEAMAWYSEAIMTDSSFTAAYCALANLYVKDKHPEDALRLLVRFERLYPNTPERWLLYRSYGKVHMALANHVRAKEVLEESDQLNPGDPEVLSLLATVYEVLHMRDLSIAKWQQYAALEKDANKRAEALLHIDVLKKKTY